MGLLRFLLAFLVVYGHCGAPYGGIGLSAQHAVQAFYMISGFYMTLVLQEKYGTQGPAGIKSFYLNRWLRLYPTYLAVVALTLLLCVAANGLGDWEPPPEAYFRSWLAEGIFEWPHLGALAVSQLTMIGLDAFNLVTLSDQGTLALTTGATVDKYPLWRLLLVPQAWSLSIELYFYAIAPFIVTRGLKAVLYLAIASYGARLLMWSAGGYYLDPWSYRFFPSELMFFLAGAIAYHAYARSPDFRALVGGRKFGLYLLMTTMVASSVWLARWGQPFSAKALLPPLFTVAVFLAIPALFRRTRNFSADRLIGELSYPIYISHILIVWIVGQGNYHTGSAGFILVSALTIAVSYALYRWIDVPIDNYRHRKLSPARLGERDGRVAVRRAAVPGA